MKLKRILVAVVAVVSLLILAACSQIGYAATGATPQQRETTDNAVTVQYPGSETNAESDDYESAENESPAVGGYTSNGNMQSDPVNLAGWITINNGRLYLDEAKVVIYDFMYPHNSFMRHAGENVLVVAPGDNERLREVTGIECDDERHGLMPNGFMFLLFGGDIMVYGNNTASFEITDDTVFTFVDMNLRFPGDHHDGNRVYQTNVLDEFLEHRYGNDSIMVFLQVQNGRVISVTEEMLFTQ